jgi:UDP-N-acetylglucosamine 2-epimerase (non-hydrolysing)
MRLRVLSVVGARPNFMKMAPVLKQLLESSHFESRLVHTGQHYDKAMSDVFFRDLGMPEPEFNLGVGSGSHARQTAEIMKGFEEVCESVKPDLVVVAGDVNSTMACALTAAKMLIPVAHLEAGLRSYDRTMPEEINRIVTDSISEILFTTEPSGNENLRREGIAQGKIHFVGNTMIDSLVRCRELLEQSPPDTPLVRSAAGGAYFVVTIHRPSNVDDSRQLHRVLRILESASDHAPVLFVAHPRTAARLEKLETKARVVHMNGNGTGLSRGMIHLVPPLSYMQFLYLVMNSTAVLTDSGGIQEETSFLGIPCLTLRENTERPVTVERGTNVLVGLDKEKAESLLCDIAKGCWKDSSIPELWDGRAAERVVEVLSGRAGKNGG